MNTPDDRRFETFPDYAGGDLGVEGGKSLTRFRIWSPEASAVSALIYDTADSAKPSVTVSLRRSAGGTWAATYHGCLIGRFYTFRIFHNGRWLGETPGCHATAVAANGCRGAIIDMKSTDPDGWDCDRGPRLANPTDAVIYELHHRDYSASSTSGSAYPGKFLAITEHGTMSPSGMATGIDHLKELGITHVQILPSADFSSVDELSEKTPRYNWGYDPQNYNAPEGSYATDARDPATRIREMKRMVMALHKAGIGVIMDVVYNHTATVADSAFTLTAPGYYYRHLSDGSLSNASGCGNETASERTRMRRFMAESLEMWVTCYHIDGFRFDLMGIHDTATMNFIAKSLRKLRPDILLYGEGWTAGDSPLPVRLRAQKENVKDLDGIAVFSDDMRDAIRGHIMSDTDRGFVAGGRDLEESVKIAIVASTPHPQIDWSKATKSRFAYAGNPAQVVNYASCHDNLCLTDRLKASMPDATSEEIKRAARLAQTIVMTSQGIPFMFAGEEIFRDKKGVANSYRSPDSVNAIDWELKRIHSDQMNYYRELIRLRRIHPAFRMHSADEIARHLRFADGTPQGLVAYTITGYPGDDTVFVAFNGSDHPRRIMVGHGNWTVIAEDGEINADGLRHSSGGRLTVARRSALILVRQSN